MKYLRLYENFEDFEETWIEDPYEDTEIKVGDKILVTDKLKDYIIKYDWPDKMYDFIDEIFVVDRTEYFYLEPLGNDKRINTYVIRDYLDVGVEWFIPFNCAKKA